jgi:hypothetical protein
MAVNPFRVKTMAVIDFYFRSRWVLVRSSDRRIREVQMTELLIRLFCVFAVLAVISLFLCTLPVWVFRRLQSYPIG